MQSSAPPPPTSDTSKAWDSTWNVLAQASPPTVREILAAYSVKGDGDRDLLVALLNAKGAEDQRIASVANLAVLQVQQSLAHVRSAQLSPPICDDSRFEVQTPSSSSSSGSSQRRSQSYFASSVPPYADSPRSSLSSLSPYQDSASLTLPPMRIRDDSDPRRPPQSSRPHPNAATPRSLNKRQHSPTRSSFYPSHRGGLAIGNLVSRREDENKGQYSRRGSVSSVGESNSEGAFKLRQVTTERGFAG